MRMVWVKWEDKFQVASFIAEKVVNNEAENAIQATVEEGEVISDKIENELHYLIDGVMRLLPTMEEASFTINSFINGRSRCNNFLQ